MLISHPVFWTQGRAAGQSLVEDNSTYGHIYHVGTTADMMEMAHREDIQIYMPHPRSKGSTGFPDAIRNTPHFLDSNYRGIGFRWGMGLDGSEQRLCEYRCLPLLRFPSIQQERSGCGLPRGIRRGTERWCSLTESPRASTANRTAAMVPPAIGTLTQCS